MFDPGCRSGLGPQSKANLGSPPCSQLGHVPLGRSWGTLALTCDLGRATPLWLLPGPTLGLISLSTAQTPPTAFLPPRSLFLGLPWSLEPAQGVSLLPKGGCLWLLSPEPCQRGCLGWGLMVGMGLRLPRYFGKIPGKCKFPPRLSTSYSGGVGCS